MEVQVDGMKISKVVEFAYLGQLVTTQNDKAHEFKRRIAAGLIAFNKNIDILKSIVPM